MAGAVLRRSAFGAGVTAVLGLGLLLGLSTWRGQAPRPSPARQGAGAISAYGRLPFAFQPNLGETDARADFFARGGGATILLGAREASVALDGATLGMRLVAARPESRLEGSQRLPGRVNEFVGNDPSRWRTNIPTYATLSARNVYPGIDLAWHGRQGRLEYDFLVSPGADPSAIELRFDGVRGLRIESGDLLLDLPDGALRETRPRIYQLIDGRREPVAGRFVLGPHGLVGFDIPRYDASRPLLIDPTLACSTYLGGAGTDVGYGIAVDSSGSAYVTGSTSGGFPTAGTPYQPVFAGGSSDVFVAKLNPAGTALVYSTYLGGSTGLCGGFTGGLDVGRAIAVDSAGNAYVTGETASTDFPTMNALQPSFGGCDWDAFVTKLGAGGDVLLYSTYNGGSRSDLGHGIAVDAAGEAYVAGESDSADFPTTVGAYQPGCAMAFSACFRDAFLTKLNATGSARAYSTFLGGADQASSKVTDRGLAVAVDSSGAAYLTGETDTPNFPTTVGAFQPANAGALDAFVAKLNPAGAGTADLVYSSLLGGSDADHGAAIAIAGGNIYLTGHTTSVTSVTKPFPTTTGVFQPTDNSIGEGAFVTRVNPAGGGATDLVYSSFLGGSSNDFGWGIVVDSIGDAVVTGQSNSTDFPSVNPIQATLNGINTNDVFVSTVNATASALRLSTFLGGDGEDYGYAIALDGAGSAYITGNTTSATYPTKNPFQGSNNGSGDALVTKIAGIPTMVVVRSFSAGRSGGFVVLRWRTASELSLLGFNVYREQGGTRVRLNGALIPVGARSYAFRDRNPSDAARYWLQEVRLDGSRVWHGPMRVG